MNAESSTIAARAALERFDGADAWPKLPPEAQARIGAMALELALGANIEDRTYQDSLPALFERVAAAARRELERDLRIEVEEALPEDAFVGGDGRSPRIPSLLGGVCRVCGCSQNDACPEGCGWAAEDLCTACVEGGGDGER